MRVHLFRHGEAVPGSDPSVARDAERPLAEAGRRQVRQAARGLAALGVEPDRALASPYTRARRTARLAVEALDGVGEVTELQELRPRGDPADTRQALAGLERADEILLCGHRPHLPKLAASLLTGQADGLDLDVSPASLATIDVAIGTPEALGTLARLVQPDALRTLGRV